MEVNYDFNDIVKKFRIEGRFLKAEPYGNGHINSTYAAYFEKDCIKERYIIQKINTDIFKSPEKLMENIKSVTSHLRSKIISSGGNPDHETLTFINTVDGKNFYKNETGDYWRCCSFIENTQSYQRVENPKHLYNSGRTFGKFLQYLSDFPADKLHETIPFFHDTEKRYMAFLEAVRNDIKGRAGEVKDEIKFLMDRAADTKVLLELLKEGKVSLRVIHNDTKFDNILIDNVTGEGLCVVDLDTVMPGLSLYDFGDAIRSGANPAKEDETDLSKVWLDLELFESFTKGFIETAGKSLTETEIKYLSFSVKLMALECGMRFLTDYLNGDIYFRIHREKQNLDRARNQFKLVVDIENKLEKMNEIVMRVVNKKA